MKTLLFILGAADPEMVCIEELVFHEAEHRVAYATSNDARVNTGNAYKADGLITGQGAHMNHFYGEDEILVECGFPENPPRPWETARIDHHRQGDPGFDRGPEEFLYGSSLGQVISLLATRGEYPGKVEQHSHAAAPGEFVFEVGEDYYSEVGKAGWRVVNDRWLVITPTGAVEVRNEHVMAAASDHCPGHAYQGKCPGVYPDDLMWWRATDRAAFQGRRVPELMAEVKAARVILRGAPLASLQDGGLCQLGDQCQCGRSPCDEASTWVRYPSGPVPELPEAALREGIPYLADVLDRDGREKVVLGSASGAQVHAFLRCYCPSFGLVDTYGSRERGYAGGYKEAQR